MDAPGPDRWHLWTVGWPLALSAEPSFSLASGGQKQLGDLASLARQLVIRPFVPAKALSHPPIFTPHKAWRGSAIISLCLMLLLSIYPSIHASDLLVSIASPLQTSHLRLVSMAAAAWGFLHLPCDFVSYRFNKLPPLWSPPAPSMAAIKPPGVETSGR